MHHWGIVTAAIETSCEERPSDPSGTLSLPARAAFGPLKLEKQEQRPEGRSTEAIERF